MIRRIVLEMTATILLTPTLDILAGALLRAREPQLLAVPVLLALIPPFVSQAGALGGIFSSRITSKLQIGVITARGRPEAPAILDAAIVAVLSVIVFAAIGALGYVLGRRDRPRGRAELRDAARRDDARRASSSRRSRIVASYYLAIVTYRFGLDPDNQSVPIITSLMDLSGVAVVLFVMTSSGVLPHG